MVVSYIVTSAYTVSWRIAKHLISVSAFIELCMFRSVSVLTYTVDYY